MKQETFEKILKMWREEELKRTSEIYPAQTNGCLSFVQLEKYGKGQYTSEQKMHVEGCEYCQRMVRLFRKQQHSLGEKVRITRIIIEMAKEHAQNMLERLFNVWRRIPLPGRIAIPSLVTIGVLLFALLLPVGKYSNLAQIERIYYQPLITRGEAEYSEAERLFIQGMSFYQKENYAEAIKKLSMAVEKNPIEVEFHFYLGLCYLLERKPDPDQAILQLQKAIELSGNSLLEKCYWYLGNAYLLKEDAEGALTAFEKVVDMEGDYKGAAHELIAGIKKMKGKKEN